MKKLIHTSHFVLLLRILIVLGLYTLLRTLFYCFNRSYFFDLSSVEFFKALLFGLRFDLVAVVALSLPAIIMMLLPIHTRQHKSYTAIVKYLFIIFNSVGLLANTMDIEYFKFVSKRSTFDIFSMLGFGSEFWTLLPRFFIDYYYIVIIFASVVVALIYLYRLTEKIEVKFSSTTHSFYLFQSLWLVITMLICVLCIRGGLQLKPLSIINAGEYVSSKNTALLLNTPFTIIKTIGKTELQLVKYIDEKDLQNYFNPVKQYSNNNKGIDKLNIVIIVLESFSKEYIGALNRNYDNGQYKGYTPFLDSLIGHSLVFENAYANGRRSIEAIPAIVSSIPSLMNNAFISSSYSANNISSIAKILKPEGYYSAFFHGGNNGTMGFEAYSKLAGFDKYFGREQYNNNTDYDGNWGIWDEPFLQYTANTIDGFHKPYVAVIFTLSSHHPFQVPPKYKTKFSRGTLPIHQSIGYTDYALRKFFEKISKTKTFENTLFVITADHSQQAYYNDYKSDEGIYRIPIIFYKHNSNLNKFSKQVTQQTDIMPSVLQYINYSRPFYSFGESVFDTTAHHFAVNYLSNRYQYLNNRYIIDFDGKQSRFSYYSLDVRAMAINDTTLQANWLKAYIQIYNQSLITNKMTAK